MSIITNKQAKRTNLQLKVPTNANCVRKMETRVQGFGPRASHSGAVRTPVIAGGDVALTEQSAPI